MPSRVRDLAGRYAEPVLAAAFALSWLVGATSGGVPRHQPDLTVWTVCGLLVTVPFAWRRSLPLLVAAVVVGGGTSLGLILRDRNLPIALVLAAPLATYGLGAYVAPRRSVPAVVLFTGLLALSNAFHQDDSGVTGDILTPVLFCLIPYAVGRVVARLRQEQSSLRRLTVRLEREQAELARAAVTEERSRIARELHDIVAHSISVMVVQAGAAAQFVDADSRASEPIEAIRTTGQQALAEMRRLLGILRTDEAPVSFGPQPGLDGLDALVDTARAGGLDVTLAVQGVQVALPAGVDVAAYRLVQESFSNVRKHARARAAEVTLRFEPTCLSIVVADDGIGLDAASDAPGHGLIGMRERVALYGGDLECGPGREGGWRVHARLPLAG